MRTSGPLLILSLCVPLVLLSGCSEGEGELSGEVFVVTKGRQNVRLALVEVRAISEDAIKPFIEMKIATSQTEREKLRPEIEKAKTEVTEAEEAVKSAGRMQEMQMKAFLEAVRRGDLSERRARRSYLSGSNIVPSKIETKSKKQAKLQALLDQDLYWRSGDFYLTNLPAGIATTKTDADGKFTLILKRRQRVALAAQASRNVGSETEKYHWLIWFSLEGNKSKKLFLSNDNLLTAGSADSLVKAAE